MVTIDTPDSQHTSDFTIVQGDTEPAISAVLRAPDDTDENLNGDSVKFQMAKPGASSLKVDTSATIVDADTGEVMYSWSSSDTDTAGYYNARWVVDNGSTGTYDESFPSNGFLVIEVEHPLV